MQDHSAPERSAWYAFLMLGRVPSNLTNYPFQTVFQYPKRHSLLQSERALMKSRQRRSPSVEEKPRPHGASLGRRPRRCRSIVINPGLTHRRRDALSGEVPVNTGFIHAPPRLPRGPRVQRGRRRRSLDCCLAGRRSWRFRHSRPPPLPDQNRRRQRTVAHRRRGPCRRVQLIHRPPPTTKVLSNAASRYPTLPSTVSGRGPLPCSSSTPALTPSSCSGDWRRVGARSSSACGRGVASTAIRASPVRPPKPDAPAAKDRR
jgi:hypothetical protein